MGNNDDLFVGIMILLIAGLFYFIPTIVSVYRNHKNTVSLFLLNLLLGWTFLGWAAALIWSFSANTEVPRATISQAIQAENNSQPEFESCPFCAEEIKVEAILCKHCGSNLHNQETIENNA